MKRCGYGLSLLVGIVAYGVSGGAVEAGDADLQLRFADGLMARGIYEHAIREYLIFQEQYPDHVSMDVIHFRVGEAYRRLGNFMAAVRAYNAVIDARPHSDYRHRAMLRRADVYRQANRPEIAARQFATLLAEPDLDSALADAARFWKANALVAQGDREAAIRLWRELLKADRESEFKPFAVLEVGKQLAVGDESDQRNAMAYLRRIVDQPPDIRHGAEALYQLARLQERLGDDAAAAEAFDDFLETYPDDLRAPAIRLPAAWTFYRVGRFADSLRLCRDATRDDDALIENAGHGDQWWYLKANNKRRLKNHASAVVAYQRLLTDWPESTLAVAATIEKAQSLVAMGNHERALQTVQRLRRADARRLPARWLRALSHEALGQTDEAIQEYRLIMEREPETEEAYEATYRLAMLYRRRGDLLPASEMFQRVAERYPDRPLAPRALLAAADALEALGRDADAVRVLSGLLQGYPEHELIQTGLRRKALLETRLDRRPAAMATYVELLDRFPESDDVAESAFSLAMMYFSKQDYDAAADVLKRALKADPAVELRSRIVFRRALALQQLQRDSEAAALFQELLDDPRPDQFDPTLLEWLTVQLRQEGRPADALRAAELLVERAGDATVWRRVGLLLAGLSALDASDRSLGEQRLTAALALDAVTPYDPDGALQLGHLLLDAGRNREAMDRFRQADAFARDPALSGIRALALFGLGRAYEAEEEIQAANRYYTLVGMTYDIPDLSPAALRKAADTFDRMNRAEDRDKILAELQERYPDP